MVSSMSRKRFTPGAPWAWIQQDKEDSLRLLPLTSISNFGRPIHGVRFACLLQNARCLPELLLRLQENVPLHLCLSGVTSPLASHAFDVVLPEGLHSLHLESSCIGDEGFAALASSIPTLKRLSARNNGITDSGILRFLAIAHASKTPPRLLRWLDLRDNAAVRHTGARAVVARMGQLDRLDLRGCGLSLAAVNRVWVGIQSNRKFRQAHTGWFRGTLMVAWAMSRMPDMIGRRAAEFLARRPHPRHKTCVHCRDAFEAVQVGNINCKASDDWVASLDACWDCGRCYWPEQKIDLE